MRAIRTGKKGARMLAGLGMGLALGLTLGLVLTPGNASAEPYFTVRDGVRCSTCHVNRTGGFKRTAYAQVYMQTRMTADAGGGHMEYPRLYHGQINEFISIGADIRAAANWYKDEESPDSNWQFDRPREVCKSCHGNYDGKRAEYYVQLEPLPGRASLVFGQNLLHTSGVSPTREAYALVENMPANGYVKIGTFRLHTGLNNTFDNPFLHGEASGGRLVPVWSSMRGQGMELGFEPGSFSVSFNITNPLDPVKVPKGKRIGWNAYAVLDPLTLGMVSYRDPMDDEKERRITGYYAGLALGRFTMLAEVDTLSTPEDGGAVKEKAWLGEVNLLLTRGHNIKLQYEAHDPDTGAPENIHDRTGFIYEPFITRYLQMRFGTRLRHGPHETQENNGREYFIETHMMY
ncbi:MAG: hypothetical protein OEZ59_06990 [Deltaproteobacteria bacterium]|nr:hypothetical protein [Deltaproteobacteria bacterium]